VHFTSAIRIDVVTSVPEPVPKVFALEQNYPNPFNPVTTFQFSIVDRQLTILKVYDVLGRGVATLVNKVMEPGTYTVQWDARLHSVNSGGQASGFASGLYFYKLQSGTSTQLRKMLLLK